MAAPEQHDLAIVDLLHAAGLGLAKGTNLFAGPVRAVSKSVPDRAVFCLALGTGTLIEYVDGGAKTGEGTASVQIRVREKADQFETGQALARSVLAKIHLANLPGYTHCRAMDSMPGYIGQSDAGHHEWSINVELWFAR